MNKEFKVRISAIFISIFFYFLLIIGICIYAINNMKNLYTAIWLSIYGCLVFTVICTIAIFRGIHGKIIIDKDKINSLYKSKIVKQIDLNNIIRISYHSIPLVKGLEMIIIYENNKKPLYMDFGVNGYLEIYKYMVDYCKKNTNTLIDERLIKRLESIKFE